MAKDYDNVPAQYTDLCTGDHTQFAKAIAEHENKLKAERWRNHQVDYTEDMIQKSEHYQAFLAEAKEGDKLQFYVWNAGFLAYSDGYVLVRGDEQIISITVCVS